jgi:steroid delta-isomerase-like uncharacterized protein
MSVEANKATVSRFIEEFWNQRKLELADEVFAADSTCPSVPFIPNGPEGVKVLANVVFTAFPDFTMRVEKMIGSDDMVGAYYFEHGTHKSDFMGTPATGKTATWEEMGLFKFREDGKVSVCWFETDMMGLMTQLGVMGNG